MKKEILSVTAIMVAMMMLSGCATNGSSQQTTEHTVNSSSGTTVSGYVDVGVGKTIH